METENNTADIVLCGDCGGPWHGGDTECPTQESSRPKRRRQLVRDAMTDGRAGMIRLEAHDYEPAAVLLRMALDQLEEAGVLKNV